MKQFLRLVLLLFSTTIFGQVQEPVISRLPQILGQYDFTAIGNTLRSDENPSTCDLLPSSSDDLNLLSTQTIFKAYLCWSSSGAPDNEVSLNGQPVRPDLFPTEDFFAEYNNVEFHAHRADVTSLVQAIGNGTYTFSDYKLSTPCGGLSSSLSYGGWALYVIYNDPSLTQNQIKIFEGLSFESSQSPNLSITLDGLEVATDVLSKVGVLVWEGDDAVFPGATESLKIDGVTISAPPLNPGDNAFNGTNTYNGSAVNYNMDLDYFDLEGIISPGATSILVEIESSPSAGGGSSDLIIINNLITVVNSEIPDAACNIDGLDVICDNGQNLFVDYTIFNLPSTSVLEAGTRYDFYWQDLVGGPLVFIESFNTPNDIPIGGQESFNTILSIAGTPAQFNLILIVDPPTPTNPNGAITEIDETNNDSFEFIDTTQPFSLGVDVESCAGLTVTLDTGVSSPNFTWQWYKDGNIIPGETNPSITVGLSGVYTVEGFEGPCFITDDIEVTFNPPPDIFPPQDLFLCDDGATAGSFDLTENDDDLLGPQDPALYVVKYYETLTDAQNDTNVILVPTGYFITPPSPQTIYARVESPEGCFAIEQFKIFFTRVQGGQPDGIEVCDNDNDGFTEIDLPLTFDAEVLDGEPAADI